MACVIIANGIMIGFQTDPEYRDWDGPCLGTDFETSSGSPWVGFGSTSQVGFGSRQPLPSS